jgi:hypothetical protein
MVSFCRVINCLHVKLPASACILRTWRPQNLFLFHSQLNLVPLASACLPAHMASIRWSRAHVAFH